MKVFDFYDEMSHSRIFDSFWDVTITVERLHDLTYAGHS